MTSRELHWEVSGQDISVRVEESRGRGTFHIADRSIPFQIIDHNTLETGGRHVRFHLVRDGDSYTVWINGRTYQLRRISKSHLAEAAATLPNGEIRALMPGKVLRLEVAVGDTVLEKQTVAIMESMKMESALKAPRAGRIAEIRCQPGQVVEMGEVIMVID
jgi:3-methylcrotonyl-CoA carboxylase alpha subunit